jgi:hypothetical protein
MLARSIGLGEMRPPMTLGNMRELGVHPFDQRASALMERKMTIKPKKDPLEGFDFIDYEANTEYVTIQIHRTSSSAKQSLKRLGRSSKVGRTSKAFTSCHAKRSDPKHPPGPPMTLGNMRELGPLGGSLRKTSPRPRKRSGGWWSLGLKGRRS